LLTLPVQCETLRERVMRAGWLSPETSPVWSLVLQISEGLKYAHGEGVLHLCLTPEHILIDEAECAIITGFGFSSNTAHRLYSHDTFAFQTRYSSPELRPGELPDARADIYSLGVIVYEMLTDRLPHEDETEQQTRYRNPLPPHLIVDSVSPVISDIILRMISRDREKRFETVEEFQRALVSAIDCERTCPISKPIEITNKAAVLESVWQQEETLGDLAPPDMVQVAEVSLTDGILQHATGDMTEASGESGFVPGVEQHSADDGDLSVNLAAPAQYEYPRCNEIRYRQSARTSALPVDIDIIPAETGISAAKDSGTSAVILNPLSSTYAHIRGTRGGYGIRFTLVVALALILAALALAVRNLSAGPGVHSTHGGGAMDSAPGGRIDSPSKDGAGTAQQRAPVTPGASQESSASAGNISNTGNLKSSSENSAKRNQKHPTYSHGIRHTSRHARHARFWR
ncbi:MAG TPA: protein kinase, partial [Blastocatellia bacterium]|nr:protein kinase [Blastocatellia bacterium]